METTELMKQDYKELKKTLKNHGFNISVEKDYLHIMYQGEKSYSFNAHVSKKYVRAKATIRINKVINGEVVIYEIPKMSLLEVSLTGAYYFYNIPGTKRKLAVAARRLHNKIRLIFTIPFDTDKFVYEKFPLTYFTYADITN